MFGSIEVVDDSVTIKGMLENKVHLLYVVFQLICYVRMPSIFKTDCCADRSMFALLNAYIKNMT